MGCTLASPPKRTLRGAHAQSRSQSRAQSLRCAAIFLPFSAASPSTPAPAPPGGGGVAGPRESWGAGGLHPPFTTFLAVRRSSILHFYSFLPAILQLVWAAHSVRGVRDEPFLLLIFLPHGSAAAPEAARTGIAGR